MQRYHYGTGQFQALAQRGETKVVAIGTVVNVVNVVDAGDAERSVD